MRVTTIFANPYSRFAFFEKCIFGMCLNEDESLKMEDFSFNLPEGYLEQMHRKEMPFNRRNEVKSHSLP